MRTAAKMKKRRSTVPLAEQRRIEHGSKASRIPIPAVSVRAQDDAPRHSTVLPDLRSQVEEEIAAEERERPSSETRNFSGAKMARILALYEIDMGVFVEAYDKLPRQLDLWKEPDEYEILAMESFLQHQDTKELCEDLDCTLQNAYKVITRYLIWAHNQEEEAEEEEETNGVVPNGTGLHQPEETVVTV